MNFANHPGEMISKTLAAWREGEETCPFSIYLSNILSPSDDDRAQVSLLHLGLLLNAVGLLCEGTSPSLVMVDKKILHHSQSSVRVEMWWEIEYYAIILSSQRIFLSISSFISS